MKCCTEFGSFWRRILTSLCLELSCTFAVAGMLLYPNSSSCIYAAVCAVVSVNIVIAMFVYVAWNSEPDSRRPAAATKLD